MNKIGSVLMGCLTLLWGCSTEYNITGDSSLSTLDGRMLYLNVTSLGNEVFSIDSCEVVHGKFSFMGVIDSVQLGELCMDNQNVMPLVLERGNLSVRISDLEQSVMGGTLNNRLYEFLGDKNRLENQIQELSTQEARLILSGQMDAKQQEKLKKKSDKVYEEIEELETEFIIDNHDNVLGQTYFILLCSQYPYPIITSQIEYILDHTTPAFRRHPFVNDYINTAEVNMRYLHWGE